MIESKDEDSAKGRPNITVKVNKQDVLFKVKKATGAEIKSEAINQNVQIQPDFNLFEKLGNGGKLKPIKDDQEIPLHPNQEFRAVAPDDNSQK